MGSRGGRSKPEREGIKGGTEAQLHVLGTDGWACRGEGPVVGASSPLGLLLPSVRAVVFCAPLIRGHGCPTQLQGLAQGSAARTRVRGCRGSPLGALPVHTPWPRALVLFLPVSPASAPTSGPCSGPPLQTSTLWSGRCSHPVPTQRGRPQLGLEPAALPTTHCVPPWALVCPHGCSLCSQPACDAALRAPPSAHSLEAVPGSSGAPQVLPQRVHKLAQLLRAHGHLLPDQLQVLRGHRVSERGCPWAGRPAPWAACQASPRRAHPALWAQPKTQPPFREARTIGSK